VLTIFRRSTSPVGRSAIASRILAITTLVLLGTNTANAQTGIRLIQHTSKDGGSVTSSSQAFAGSNVAGNWIGVVVRGGVMGETFTVSDSNGNTYQQGVKLNVTVDTPAGDTLAIYYAENIRSGANTVTVVGSAAATLRFAILEYAGVALASSLDVTAAAQGTCDDHGGGRAGAGRSGRRRRSDVHGGGRLSSGRSSASGTEHETPDRGSDQADDGRGVGRRFVEREQRVGRRAGDVSTGAGGPAGRSDADEDACGVVYAGADGGELYADGRQSGGRWADGRDGDGERCAAEWPDGDDIEWSGLELHGRDGELHAQRRTGGGGELPGDHADGDGGGDRAGERDQHGDGERGRRNQHGQRQRE
jgi:hypothetical protein